MKKDQIIDTMLEFCNEKQDFIDGKEVNTYSFSPEAFDAGVTNLIAQQADETPSDKDWISVEDAGIVAVKISEGMKPKLTAQERAFFIAGFQECIKYLNNPLPPAPGTKVEDWKDKRIEELEQENAALKDAYVERNDKVNQLQSKYEHMKKRMEAAEVLLEKYYKRIPDCAEYMDWQQLKETTKI